MSRTSLTRLFWLHWFQGTFFIIIFNIVFVCITFIITFWLCPGTRRLKRICYVSGWVKFSETDCFQTDMICKMCTKRNARRFECQCGAFEGQAEGLVEVLAGNAAEASTQSGKQKNFRNSNCFHPDNCSSLSKRGLPEKWAGVGLGRPDQSLGFKNFQTGKEGEEEERDNHLVKWVICVGSCYTTTFMNLSETILIRKLIHAIIKPRQLHIK